MKAYIDRFEGDFAVFVDLKTRVAFDVPREKIKFDAREGDVVHYLLDAEDAACAITLLPEETEARRDKYSMIMARLRKKK